MARLLIRLKLRLLTNALRSTTPARVSFIVSTVFAVLLAIGTFTVLALYRGKAGSVDLSAIIFTVFAFGWLILPILAFGLDTTLDPATLVLYPLRTRPLAVGLLAASATGAWPLANLIGLLGITVGLASGPLGVVVAVVAVVLQVLFCMVLARFVTTSLARMLRSRRGKDLAAFLIVPIVALYEFFSQVIPSAAAAHKITATSFAGVDAWLRWLPPGMAVHSVADASDGRPGIALARLGMLAGIIVVLGWLWIRSLNRALVTTDTTTQSAQVRAGALPFARFGLRGAVAARYWIYQRREPASLVFWGITAVVMAAVSIRAIVGPQRIPGVLLASAGFGAAFVGFLHANSAALSGPPFVAEAMALTNRRALRAWFSGQNIVLALIGVPLLSAISFGLAAAARSPGYGLLGMAVDLAGLGAALAISNVFSVVLAHPMEKRPGNPIRVAAQGYGAYRFLGVFGNLLGVGIGVGPLIAAIALTSAEPATVRMPVLVVCAAAWGFALAWLGVRVAARAAEHKLPELCQIAVRSPL